MVNLQEFHWQSTPLHLVTASDTHKQCLIMAVTLPPMSQTSNRQRKRVLSVASVIK